MQKKHLVLGSLISTLALTACNSGGSTTPNSNNVSSVNTTTKLPVIVGESNQRLFDVNYDNNKNSKTLTNAHTTKFISLRPLTKEQAIDADKIGLEALRQLHTTSLNSGSSSTFKASQRVIDTPEFFDGHQEVLDQGAFGSCVTFATDAALSYVSTGTSNNIAPLDTLLQGYLNHQDDMGKTGWDGLNGPGQVLLRIIDANEGYYRNYAQTKDLYEDLSNNYSAIKPNGDLTFSTLNSVTGFQENIEYFNSTVKTNYPHKQIKNIAYKDLGINQGSTTNAIKLKAALDSGHKVIIGFVIYDAAQKSGCKNGNVNGDSYFKYNTKTLVTSASNVSNKKDAWTRAYGCALGGHEVIVTSYFENEDGQLIFLIRNSWSDKSGDQGNYYMTGDYFNRAGMDGYEVYAIRNQ